MNTSSKPPSPASKPSEGGGVSTTSAESTTVAKPTARQLMMHAIQSAVPMIGFGFMDNTIMIHAGHYVDCTLGVTFGLSTLAAAGIGQIFSGIGGVMFGDALEAVFQRMSGAVNGSGVADSSTMSKAQRTMRVSRMAGLMGGIFGVALGCTLGLVNLFFVDEYKANLLKLHSLEEGQEFEFEVEVDNTANPGFTTVIVRGPDVDGVLASITASISSCGCSVAELHAGYRRDHFEDNAAVEAFEEDGGVFIATATEESGGSTSENGSNENVTAMESITNILNPTKPRVEDIFLIRDRSSHQALDNDELDGLARTILAAAKDPLNSHSLKSQLEELQFENMALADRVLLLEKMLEDRQIKVVPSLVKRVEVDESKQSSGASGGGKNGEQ